MRERAVMNTVPPPTVPDALLLVSPGCPHCDGALQSLGHLVKEGVLGRLEVVNVAVHAERAAALGTRSVPWIRIGELEFDEALPEGELRNWAARAASPDGLASYFLHMLKNGRRGKVETMLRADPRRARFLVNLLENSDTSMAVRLGIGAVLEELQGSGVTDSMIPGLGVLATRGDQLTRADACHFLALIGGPNILPYLQACLEDEDEEVRAIAQEALAGWADGSSSV
jgi:thiol-disulfide isomerase/thioredoxin